jgi:23S rRNA pseudouridine2605 synthase
MQERLQKIIAHAGAASRRRAEQLIVSGQVTLNGQVVTELGTKADPAHDHIKVAGKLLQPAKADVYVALHKPPGVVATMSDPEGRPSLGGFLQGVPTRVFPVGRLEYHAAGLLLLTNDGELANRILRAHGMPQVYLLKLKGRLAESELRPIADRTGVRLRQSSQGPNAWYEATLSEARRDRLRRALIELGHPVEKMKRIRIADLELGPLAPGRYRYLTSQEVAKLIRASEKAARGVPRSRATADGNAAAAKPGAPAPHRKAGGSSREVSRRARGIGRGDRPGNRARN